MTSFVLATLILSNPTPELCDELLGQKPKPTLQAPITVWPRIPEEDERWIKESKDGREVYMPKKVWTKLTCQLGDYITTPQKSRDIVNQIRQADAQQFTRILDQRDAKAVQQVAQAKDEGYHPLVVGGVIALAVIAGGFAGAGIASAF